jgi:MerR family transcriptional regulator, light-induced transcriptional regulator
MQLKSNSIECAMATQKPPSDVSTPFAAPQPSFRSGAVARMAGMPVATLRIWEQRYQAVGPTTAPSGHRLYAAAEVERVILLRQLTEQGHAIGSLAALDTEQLRSLALAQASVPPPGGMGDAQPDGSLRVVVVGRALAQRLKRPAVLRGWGRPPQVVAVFDSLAEATQAAARLPAANVDLLLWQTSGLQDRALPELRAAQQAWNPRGTAVAYRFAGAATRQALAGTGTVLARETADDDALGTWLRSLEAALVEGAMGRSTAAPGASPAGTGAWTLAALGLAGAAAPARRFDDATLTKFAGFSSDVACDCPSHVAELLMQVAAFEAYSADCTHRSPQDAALHADLQRVAGAARVLFEVALERVALAEGWALP